MCCRVVITLNKCMKARSPRLKLCLCPPEEEREEGGGRRRRRLAPLVKNRKKRNLAKVIIKNFRSIDIVFEEEIFTLD